MRLANQFQAVSRAPPSRRRIDGAKFRILQLHSIRPITVTPIVIMELDFLLSMQRACWIVCRGALDCLPCQIDRDGALRPTHALDPLWRDEHLMTQPPVAGVDYQVSNSPGVLIE